MRPTEKFAKAPKTDRSARGRSRVVLAIGSLCTFALLASLMVAGSQAATPTTVLLGTADQFAILAGSGITNTGQSTVTGDVGSSPTPSQTGFTPCPAANCVTLTGTNHTDPAPNDAVTQGAKVDLTTAYNDAAGRSSTSVVTELGGQTLVGGVYSSASGTFGMTGTLVLDGENNADAVFIFQTASTLITGGSANVTLTRGAQACNIFWKVGSAATLGAGSSFKGTILANDTITLGDGVTVEGRLLAGEQASGTGAVTLIHDTIIKPSACAKQSDTDAAKKAAEEKAAADKAIADKVAADKKAAAVKKAVAAKKALAVKKAVAAKKAAAVKAAAKKIAAKKRADRVKATTEQQGRPKTPITRVGLTG